MNRSLLVTTFLLVPTTALSYGPCDRDLDQLCSDSPCPDETEETCLQLQLDKIQDADCKAYVQKTAPAWQKKQESFALVKEHCQVEVEKYCGEVACQERAQKAVQVCLMSHKEYLGAACKSEINRHIDGFQPTVRKLD